MPGEKKKIKFPLETLLNYILLISVHLNLNPYPGKLGLLLSNTNMYW